MGLKKARGGHSISNAKTKLMQLGEMPAVLDEELRALALEMRDTAVNMAPTYTNALRESITYTRQGGQRNAKGQFFKGGLGMHVVELKHKKPYFAHVHSNMKVGRTGERNYEPSEKSVAAAAEAGEIAGGLFMERAMQKYTPIIAARLAASAQKFIKTKF